MQVFIQKQINAEQPYQWFLGSDESLSFERFSGQLSDLANFAANYRQVKQWVLLLPAVNCIVKSLSFSEQERKHIAKAVPYLLEESVLTDVEELHLISDKPQKSQVEVAAIDKHLLSQELSDIEGIGIHLSSALPEQALWASQKLVGQVKEQDTEAVLDNVPAQRQIIVLNDYYLIRTEGVNYAIEPAQLPLALSLLETDSTDSTLTIDVFASDQGFATLTQVLPEALIEHLSHHSFNYAETVQGLMSQAAVVQKYNFLKGQYARTINWLSLLKPWRSVLIALLAVYCVQMGLMWSENQSLQARFDAQQVEKDSLIRQVIPRGNIVDHQKQLQSELDRIQAGGGDSLFIDRLERIGSVLAAAGVQSINSMQYDTNNALTRLDFLVTDYDSLQKIIAELKIKGFEVDIQNSNAQDDLLRTRLNVKG